VMGCGPLVDVDDTSESSGDTSSATATVGTSVGTSTSVGTTSSTTTSTTASTTISTTTTDTGDPPVDGFCQGECEVPMDCCIAYTGDPQCQGMFGQYPYRFGCEAGHCQFLGCETDEECTFDGALTGWFCVGFNTYGSCVAGCAQDQDCEDQFLAGWICAAEGYCAQPPCIDDTECDAGMVCNTELGQCTSGCTSDEQCAGYGVCDSISHTCVCTSENECPDGWTCAP
jgi:hypothetical protein